MLTNHRNYLHFLKGVSSYNRQKYDQAAQFFISSITQQLGSNHQFSLTQEPTNSSLGDTFKKSHNQIGKQSKQKAFFGSYESLINLSSCFIKQKQYKKAQKLCYRALQFNAYHSVPYYNLATINIRKEKFYQALSQIKCAISCEYLRKYERLYDRKDLDSAIKYASNNLSAIKYRISSNITLLRLLRNVSVQSLRIQKGLSFDDRAVQLNCQETQTEYHTVQQLKLDIQELKKYKKIYQLQFQNICSNNFLLSKLKPQFILQSKSDFIDSTENHQKQKNVQAHLKLIMELKNQRSLYLELLAENQHDIEIEDIIKIQLNQNELSLIQKMKFKNENESEKIKGFNQLKNQEENEMTIETSFDFENSYESIQEDYFDEEQRNQLSAQKNNATELYTYQNKENLAYPELKNENPSLSMKSKNQNKNSINQKNTRKNIKGLSENKNFNNMATSVISIQDYSQTNICKNQKPTIKNKKPQYTVNLIQSVVVPQSNLNDSMQLFQIQQNTKSYDFLSIKNKSCQSLVNNFLSPVKDLRKSQYQYNSRISQSRTYMKMLSCSKCSIEHGQQDHRQKNVNLQINLTQIYNFQCDFGELQTFFIIKHDGQQIRTQNSKGKFPNWKEQIQFNVDFTALRKLKNNQNFYDDLNGKTKIKIELWATPTHFKKDSSVIPHELIQLIGEQEIDLKEQKWTKKKIVLENKQSTGEKKKTAYMYVCLQKIKQKKV